MIARLALAVVTLAGCGGKSRTSPATQPTPAAFVDADSDPRALALVDSALAEFGGIAAWERVKELSFTVTYKDGNTDKARFTHTWDRWNGRHHFVTRVADAENPSETHVQEVKHDLFEAKARPWVAVDGTETGTSEEAAVMAEAARQRLNEDLYFLAIVYKLKDPGVKLTIDNEQITIEGSALCQPSCTSVLVSFDPAVGSNKWAININNDTKQVQVLEMVLDRGRIGYELGGWIDVGGMKWPTRFQNLGLASEIIVYSDLAVR